jgi:membrane-associated phospholipid phosphatase
MMAVPKIMGCGLALALLLGAGNARADAIEAAGDVLQYAMPLTAVGIPLADGDWDGALRFTGAFVVQGVTVLALKNTVYETRPDGVGHQSFPSGHAAVTFASAEFLRAKYGWTYGVPAYALATFTAYSRVESNHHYWHDVAAGAGIGILSSMLFTQHGRIWDISPSTDGKMFGLTFKRFW